MAKNSIRDYSATNSSNTDIQSIDISEGCSPAGINNAIREVMADLKDVSTGAVALESPAFDSASLTGDLTFGDNDKAIFGAGSDLQIYHSGAGSYIDDTGTGNLFIRANDLRLQKYTGEFYLKANSDGNVELYYDNAVKLATTATGVDVTGRLNTTGNVLVGTTNTNPAAVSNSVGVSALAVGKIEASRDGNPAASFNRKTSDGNIVDFREEGTTRGSIGVSGTNMYIVFRTEEATDGVGLTASGASTGIIIPADGNGAAIDNHIDLGSSGNRFDDIYATNGTIQTSDANEKQQIASLTDAEMTAAKAISALFKTYKFNSAVEAKGDAARTHAGVIAQDVQAAMAAAGLDAGDYAFFISSTWWETQTEVPAVEAVEAVLDEDGNVVTEAVEAVAAYTRTDTYETAEEAPEGATERTRLGIRYPELLAFVGAATEQRLANIETRLAALEAN